jgi:hypothetical protein
MQEGVLTFGKRLALAGLTAAALLAQPTRVDLATQAKNIDFSGAQSTKPFKMGAVLPGTCTPGEAFFRTAAPAGENLYGCVSANTWQVLSGGEGGGSGSGNMRMTVGSGAPAGGCVAGEEWYVDTASVPRGLWYCSATGLWRKILDSSGSGPFVIAGQQAVAPDAPAPGYGAAWFDATDKVWKSVDENGNQATAVRASACDAHGGYLNRVAPSGGLECGGAAASSAYIRWDFLDGTLSGWTVETTGGGSAAWVAAEPNHPGMVRMQTDSGASSDVWLFSKSGGYMANPVHPAESFEGVYLFRLNGSQPDGNQTVRVGLFGANAAQPADGIYLEKLAADSSWYGVSRAGGVQTRSAAVGSVTGAWVAVAIRRVNGSAIGFRAAATIAGLAAAAEQTVSSNVPTASLFPAFYMRNESAVARSADVDLVDHLVVGLER